jgi:non-homologous end joining protein Ku
MPRSIWNGTITFGLTVVPVKAHSAVEDHGVHFHQVHAKDGARIQHLRIRSTEDARAPPEGRECALVRSARAEQAAN